jgi:hypothetical protein
MCELYLPCYRKRTEIHDAWHAFTVVCNDAFKLAPANVAAKPQTTDSSARETSHWDKLQEETARQAEKKAHLEMIAAELEMNYRSHINMITEELTRCDEAMIRTEGDLMLWHVGE